MHALALWLLASALVGAGLLGAPGLGLLGVALVGLRLTYSLDRLVVALTERTASPPVANGEPKITTGEATTTEEVWTPPPGAGPSPGWAKTRRTHEERVTRAE